jgi:hypothetical protein
VRLFAITSAATLGLTWLAGCGGPSPDFFIHGTGVVVRSDVPFARSEDFPTRLESTVSAALRYWGGTWTDLAGSTIALEGVPHVQCGGLDGSIGCFDGDIRVSTQDAGAHFQCVEQTVLVHEVGHAVIGDPGHRDPRWMDFSTVELELEGRPGYEADRQVPCQLAVGVWRHPPGQ